MSRRAATVSLACRVAPIEETLVGIGRDVELKRVAYLMVILVVACYAVADLEDYSIYFGLPPAVRLML
jgi:hypothetical protein